MRLPVCFALSAALALLGCPPGDDAHGARVNVAATPLGPALSLSFTVDAARFAGDLDGVALVGDPSVVRVDGDDGSELRMVYNCFASAREPQGGETCLARSVDDGHSWQDIPSTLEPDGAVLEPGAWDSHHETPGLLLQDDSSLLFFVGYHDDVNDDDAGFFGNTPVSVGRATSLDGLHFSKDENPVLRPTPGSRDDHGISSPQVIRDDDGSLLMIYSGFCLNSECPPPFVSLLSARSQDEGRSWTKDEDPVVLFPALDFAPDGIAEVGLARLPDQRWLMLFTSLNGDAPQAIGLAVADAPTGPWVFAPEPVLVPGSNGGFGDKGVVAPTILIEGDRLRVWFHGFTSDNTIQIAWAEASLESL